MLNSRSLIAVAAITTVAMMSVFQGLGQPARKTVHQAKMLTSDKVRGGPTEFAAVAAGKVEIKLASATD
jgi:hypothetical protein